MKTSPSRLLRTATQFHRFAVEPGITEHHPESLDGNQLSEYQRHGTKGHFVSGSTPAGCFRTSVRHSGSCCLWSWHLRMHSTYRHSSPTYRTRSSAPLGSDRFGVFRHTRLQDDSGVGALPSMSLGVL